MKLVKRYYSLIKPGVLFGNILTTIAGFLLASRWYFDAELFIAAVLGTTFVVASACVLNNYFDRDIDSVMERTKRRAIAAGLIRGSHAVIFSAVLGLIGILILYFYVNLLVVGIGIVGFTVYVFLYGCLSKRLSEHGTLVGSISGAMPILAGYCAVTGIIDIGAVLLFLILFFWQLPEFYSISIYRHDEYKAAKVPVVSVVRGIENTKLQILLYTTLFVINSLLLSLFGITGLVYFTVMLGFDLYWLVLVLKGLRSVADSNAWARGIFRFSLITLLVFCFLISVNGLLP